MKYSIILIVVIIFLSIPIIAEKLEAARTPVGPMANIDAGKRLDQPDSADITKASQTNRPMSTAPEKSRLMPTIAPQKNWPTGALLYSAFIPGAGQVYNGKYLKALIYGGLEIALGLSTSKYWQQMDRHQRNFMDVNSIARPPGSMTLTPNQSDLSIDAAYKSKEFTLYETARDNRNLYLWLTGLTLFISMFDAYVDAHFADFNQTDKAFDAQLIPKNDGLFLTLTYSIK
jgi:hypothetical protein